MLIGGRNNINVKLVEEISRIFPITFIDFHDLLDDQFPMDSYSPKIILSNLMDVGSEEEIVLRKLRENYPGKKIIALHCFQVGSLVKKTLDRGYDHYISIINFSEEFQGLLNKNLEILEDY